MEVSLEDIFIGKEKYLEINRYRICKKCKGNGSKDPNANTKCPGCNGKRIKLVVQRMGNTILQSQQTCPDCRGEGYIIKEEDKCPTCKGRKVNQESKTLKIMLDKGAPDGKRYTFEGESDESPGYDPGDVIIEIRIKKHPVFERTGADLTMKADISLLEALTGFQLLINHLDGRHVLINSKKGEIIKPGVIKTVKECGMPFFDHPTRFGNLYIKFNIHFPKSLKDNQKEALFELFPKITIPIKDIDKIKEKYKMTDYNENTTNTYATGGNRPDEQEELIASILEQERKENEIAPKLEDTPSEEEPTPLRNLGFPFNADKTFNLKTISFAGQSISIKLHVGVSSSRAIIEIILSSGMGTFRFGNNGVSACISKTWSGRVKLFSYRFPPFPVIYLAVYGGGSIGFSVSYTSGNSQLKLTVSGSLTATAEIGAGSDKVLRFAAGATGTILSASGYASVSRSGVSRGFSISGGRIEVYVVASALGRQVWRKSAVVFNGWSS